MNNCLHHESRNKYVNEALYEIQWWDIQLYIILSCFAEICYLFETIQSTVSIS